MESEYCGSQDKFNWLNEQALLGTGVFAILIHIWIKGQVVENCSNRIGHGLEVRMLVL